MVCLQLCSKTLQSLQQRSIIVIMENCTMISVLPFLDLCTGLYVPGTKKDFKLSMNIAPKLWLKCSFPCPENDVISGRMFLWPLSGFGSHRFVKWNQHSSTPSCCIHFNATWNQGTIRGPDIMGPVPISCTYLLLMVVMTEWGPILRFANELHSCMFACSSKIVAVRLYKLQQTSDSS